MIFTFDELTNTIISYDHTYQVGDPDYYKNIIIPDAFIVNGTLYPATNIGDNCFVGKTGVEKVIIQDLTTDLKTGVFYNCSNLIEVIVPASVSTIEGYAFLWLCVFSKYNYTWWRYFYWRIYIPWMFFFSKFWYPRKRY